MLTKHLLITVTEPFRSKNKHEIISQPIINTQWKGWSKIYKVKAKQDNDKMS